MKEHECGEIGNEGKNLGDYDRIFRFEGKNKGERVWMVLKWLISTFYSSYPGWVPPRPYPSHLPCAPPSHPRGRPYPSHLPCAPPSHPRGRASSASPTAATYQGRRRQWAGRTSPPRRQAWSSPSLLLPPPSFPIFARAASIRPPLLVRGVRVADPLTVADAEGLRGSKEVRRARPLRLRCSADHWSLHGVHASPRHHTSPPPPPRV
jgi:hypothetical protein